MEKKVKKPKTKTKTKQKKKTKQVKKTKQKQIQQQSQNVVVNVAPTPKRRRRKPTQPRLKNYSAPAPVILNPFENVYRDLILPLKEEQRILARQIRGAKLNNYTQPIESEQEQPDRTGELVEQPTTQESSSEPPLVVEAIPVLERLGREQLAKLLPQFDNFRRRSTYGRVADKGPDWSKPEVKQLFKSLFGAGYKYKTIQRYYAGDYKQRMDATRGKQS